MLTWYAHVDGKNRALTRPLRAHLPPIQAAVRILSLPALERVRIAIHAVRPAHRVAAGPAAVVLVDQAVVRADLRRRAVEHAVGTFPVGLFGRKEELRVRGVGGVGERERQGEEGGAHGASLLLVVAVVESLKGGESRLEDSLRRLRIEKVRIRISRLEGVERRLALAIAAEGSLAETLLRDPAVFVCQTRLCLILRGRLEAIQSIKVHGSGDSEVDSISIPRRTARRQQHLRLLKLQLASHTTHYTL